MRIEIEIDKKDMQKLLNGKQIKIPFPEDESLKSYSEVTIVYKGSEDTCQKQNGVRKT